ncbi:MAG: response regulator [Pirellula sp.]|jgi:CheY-like chemotaxis protein|nr:response regulator [Pirellula sp.]
MPNLNEVSVLLVEDDSLEAEAVMRGFRRNQLDCPIEIARDGVEALNWLRSRHQRKPISPLIIMLDIRMPRMDGIEFLKELRSDPAMSRSIVFILTTSTDPKDIQQAYEYSVAGFIPKGQIASDFSNLISLLRTYCSLVEFPA